MGQPSEVAGDPACNISYLIELTLPQIHSAVDLVFAATGISEAAASAGAEPPPPTVALEGLGPAVALCAHHLFIEVEQMSAGAQHLGRKGDSRPAMARHGQKALLAGDGRLHYMYATVT